AGAAGPVSAGASGLGRTAGTLLGGQTHIPRPGSPATGAHALAGAATRVVSGVSATVTGAGEAVTKTVGGAAKTGGEVLESAGGKVHELTEAVLPGGAGALAGGVEQLLP